MLLTEILHREIPQANRTDNMLDADLQPQEMSTFGQQLAVGHAGGIEHLWGTLGLNLLEVFKYYFPESKLAVGVRTHRLNSMHTVQQNRQSV